MDKRNIIIIVLIVISVCLCIGIGIVSGDKKPETTPEPVKDENYKVFNEIDVSRCSHTKCNEEYSFNNNKLKIVSTGELDYQILYNNKVILSNQEMPYLGKTIYTYDDKIVYYLYDNENSFRIGVYDPKDKDYQSFTLDKDDPNWILKNVKFSENKIVFDTSRFFKGDDFVDVETHAMVPMTNCENYKKYAEYDAAKEFEVTYSDGKFGTAVNTKTTKLKDYKEYKSLCN